jgi:hypothetical protein
MSGAKAEIEQSKKRTILGSAIINSNGGSLNVPNKFIRLTNQIPHLPTLLDEFARVCPMLQRILVAAWSTRSFRAAMHAAPKLSGHRRRVAGLARARLGAAASARSHRAGIARMITCHFF